jgi:Wiskott-Aldrich syndrome protein
MVADLELQYLQETQLPNDVHVSLTSLPKEPSSMGRPTTPVLPLSPISNRSSPSRKRQRTSSWQPLSHIPDFLPSFPTDSSPADQPLSPRSPRMRPPLLKIESPSSPLPQPSTPTYPSDYFTSVPYDQSSLSSMPEWHLPTPRCSCSPSTINYSSTAAGAHLSVPPYIDSSTSTNCICH